MKAANGIPWWYFYQTGDQLEGRHLESVDRGGRQWKAIGPERAIGCVVDPACEVVSPGLIVHHEFKRFTIGEPDGSRSTRVQTLARTLTTAGFDAPVRDNVRWNVWLKLWGNACFNPISLLTLATLDRITGEPGLRSVCVAVMGECRRVAQALQIDSGSFDVVVSGLVLNFVPEPRQAVAEMARVKAFRLLLCRMEFT